MTINHCCGPDGWLQTESIHSELVDENALYLHFHPCGHTLFNTKVEKFETRLSFSFRLKRITNHVQPGAELVCPEAIGQAKIIQVYRVLGG